MSDSDVNVNEMLQEVLGNPDAMKKISELANGLFGGGEREERGHAKEAPSNELFDKVKDYFGDSKGDGLFRDSQNGSGNLTGLLGGLDISRFADEDQIRLIKALRPYLSDDRRSTADGIIKILKLIRLANFGSRLENGR